MQSLTKDTGMTPATVTLASALQARGEALTEEEIWSLLSLAAEQLLEDLHNGIMKIWDSHSLRSPPGTGATAPLGAVKMHVYSLGMTLYWSAEFHVPTNQPLRLHEPLHTILLTMCEDLPGRRPLLQSVLEACRIHQEEVAAYPAPASLHISRLVGMVLGTISEVEKRVVEESTCVQQSRSYLLRRRLHLTVSKSPAARALDSLQPRRVSERSTETQSSLEPCCNASVHSRCNLFVNGCEVTTQNGTCASFMSWKHCPVTYSPLLHPWPALLQGQHLATIRRASGSALALRFWQKQEVPSQPLLLKGVSYKGRARPEFVLLSGASPVTLYLPGSVMTKKGKSYLALRDLCVVLLSGQCLEVKCDIESTAGAVFNAVTSFANLGETAYFGLAYVKGKEFFFLDNETRLCKIAPEGWREQPQKTSAGAFSLFLRIKFFVGHCGLPQHSLTRHQFYLQLRKDILEERLYCNDETLLQLGVLALQAEFGNYPKEQAESKAYFRVEDYIPASLIERMTALRVQVELSELHRLSSAPWGEDAELEFLRVTQQLPEYGVLVHRVFSEKKRPEGEMALGICAKGVIVYEVKNNSRIAILRFQWRETRKISTYRKKFTITSSVTGKKHTFVTDSAKTCKYLLGLCSAQHGFNAQIGSGPRSLLLTDQDKCVQMDTLSPVHQAQSTPLTWIQKLSCSENQLFVPSMQDTVGGLLSASLENFSMETTKKTGTEGSRGSPCAGREQLDSACLIQKPVTCNPVSGPPVQSVCSGLQNNRRNSIAAEPGQEIVHVTLSRDPHRGFGFVINEGDDTGQANPGIFISSIIPGGPAEKAKKIKPGGKILSLNHIRLEGFTFNMAVRMIQNSPDNIELIISQSKNTYGNTPSEEKNSTSSSGAFSTYILSSDHQESLSSHMQDQNRATGELEVVPVQSSMPRQRPQIAHLPLKGAGSCPISPSETNTGEIYFVELVKEDGSLGFSVTGGINTRVPYGGIYVKSIIPGGPAAKEGQILCGDRLLQVDGISLCGLTHKQAVQCLKGPGQVARLVLERRDSWTAQQCLSANDRMGGEQAAVALVTALPGRPASCVSVTDGPKFEVKLKKNTNGLGFSFVQLERESCSQLKNDLVRIKRLFPGQPAEEHGAIEAGDIILAVNGKPTEGLVFQEVLHLLRGAPQEVTLLLCRPPPGALPDIEQEWETPVLSADKDLTRASFMDSEQCPSLNLQEDSWRDCSSPDVREGLGLRPESFHKAMREGQGGQDGETLWARSLTRPLESLPHLCKLHQEKEMPILATSLEKDMRQNCYSVCDIRKLGSPGLHGDDVEGALYYLPETPSPTWEDEHYLTIRPAPENQLPSGECLEADSGTIPIPQFCSWGALPESLLPEGFHGSESEWEDLEEPMDAEGGALR